MRNNIATFFTLLVLLITASYASAEVVYTLDFTKQKDGSAFKWLESNGFNLKQDADEMILQFETGKLIIGTDDDINGVLIKEVKINNAKQIRIEWGVIQYPSGADWEGGVLREAVGVIMTFGTKKIDSGSFVIPNIPYFINIFLGEKEIEGKAYVGKYFKKGGRYFCSPCRVPVGESVVTVFNFNDAFKKQFKLKTVPPITALAIEADTRDTKGISKAFIKKIELLSD